MKNCEAIAKYVVVNCKHGGLKMYMAIKKMEEFDITIPDSLDKFATRVKIFIW